MDKKKRQKQASKFIKKLIRLTRGGIMPDDEYMMMCELMVMLNNAYTQGKEAIKNER